MANKKRKAKIIIQWNRLIPAVMIMVAALFVFTYLIYLVLRPKTPRAPEAMEAEEVIEVPEELKTTNQDCDSTIEQDANYTIAAYYPKNVDAQILQMIKKEITAFKGESSEEDRELYIDYTFKEDTNFRVYRFFKKSGKPGELVEKELLEATLTGSHQMLAWDTIFEGNYKEQISARMRKRFWKENRDRPSFYEYTDPSSEVFEHCTFDEEGVVFTLDKGKLYLKQSGTFEEKFTYEEMAYYLKEPLLHVQKSETDPYHERYIDIHKPMVALTYDDGPYSKVTSRILDLLEQYDSTATFFVVGSRVGNSYDNGCVERAIQMGCDIGNHTFSHKYELPDLSVSDMLDELGKCDSAVQAVAPGYQMRFMRPTAGAITNSVKENVPYAIITWSLDTLDWSYQDRNKIYEQVTGSIEDGDIILMHDLYEETYEATARLIPDLIDRYQFVSVSELLEYKGDDVTIGRVYKHEKD